MPTTAEYIAEATARGPGRTIYVQGDKDVRAANAAAKKTPGLVFIAYTALRPAGHLTWEECPDNCQNGVVHHTDVHNARFGGDWTTCRFHAERVA